MANYRCKACEARVCTKYSVHSMIDENGYLVDFPVDQNDPVCPYCGEHQLVEIEGD